MFESFSTANQRSGRSIRAVILLAAISLHAIVLGVAVARNYLAVPEIPEPSLLVEFLSVEPPPPPPPSPTAGGGSVSKPETESEPEVTPKEEVPDFDVIAEPIEIATEIDLDRHPRPSPLPPSPIPGAGSDEHSVGPGGFPNLDTVVPNPDVPARRIKMVEPRYPELAQMAGIHGEVVLRMIILKDGSIGDIEVIRELPMGCTDAAIEAVRSWRYEPAKQNGVSVTTLLEVTVKFVLK